MPVAGAEPMGDGFPIRITLAIRPNLYLWERQVTPPGISGRGPIDISTQYSSFWVEKRPKQLKDFTPMRIMAGFLPAAYNDLIAVCQVVTLVNVSFVLIGRQITFPGWLDEFNPQQTEEGNFPMAECVFIPAGRLGSLTGTFPQN